MELRKPDKKYLEIELKPTAFTRAAADTETAEHFEQVLDDWCVQVERLLEEGEGSRKEPDDAGPDTELEFWRTRMAQFNSVMEQLKTREAKLVVGVCMAARSRAHRNWKAIDMKVTDAANEAKDNVKYLTTLEKSLEPLYLGTPPAVVDSLPALLNNIKARPSALPSPGLALLPLCQALALLPVSSAPSASVPFAPRAFAPGALLLTCSKSPRR